MDSTELRDLCLEQQSAEETFPFTPDVSAFKVGGKIFALTALQELPLKVSVKCEPALSEVLRSAHESIVPGYHLNKRHWITITLNGDVDDDHVRELIEESYDLVAPKRR